MLYNLILTPALALLLTTTLAAPTTAPSGLTQAQLEQLAPTSKSCAGAKQPLECKTAADALAPINAAFARYSITDPATKAAVLSTMAYESEDFKYAKHYFPSPNPGQGTRNMQSADFNKKYAQSLQGKMAQVKVVGGPEPVLDSLLKVPVVDFGSAMWFLTTICERPTIEGLRTGTTAAFAQYVRCIQTDVTPERTDKFQMALKALQVKSS